MRLWFESLYSDLRLPFWLGTAILSLAPFMALLFFGYYLAGVWADLFNSGVIYFAPIAAILSAYLLYAARYIRRKMETLAEYCNILREDEPKTTLAGLCSFRATLVTFLIAIAIVQPVYMYSAQPPSYTLLQRIAVSLPFIYWNLIIATMIWAFGYGMFAIFRMGRFPLKLKSFTEDRTLGLRPFGTTSLRLTGTYYLFLAMIFAPQALLGFLTSAVLAIAFGFLIIGTLLFFLPLFTYRRMLLLAKREIMEWLAPQYSDLVKRIQQNGIRGLDTSLVNEITVIEKLQKDIHQIHTWPFDVGVIARLAAIVFSISAIILSKYIQIALHL